MYMYIYNYIYTLRKLYLHFLSHWMGYDRGDNFLSILNQMELNLVQNRKENCHNDHIPFNVKGIRNIQGVSLRGTEN